MIATIIPIKRLPRHLELFDYSVPEEFEKRIRPGQLITIPFRKSEAYGLVFSCQKRNQKLDTPLKPINGIVHDTPLVSKEQLSFLQTSAGWYGVSLATLAKMSLLPIQKRKLQNIVLKKTKSQKTPTPQKPAFHTYQNEKEHQVALKDTVEGQTLILVPELRYIDNILSLLDKEKKDMAVAWHSGLSIKEKFERWLEVRNGGKTIIVGTRAAVFLPFPRLKTIIVDFEQKENHKHWDQTPRFHAKDAARLLSNVHGSNLHLMSYSPSVESYFYIHKNHYKTREKDQQTAGGRKPPILVDMTDERRGKNFSLYSNVVEEALLKAKKDVFFFIQRLGFATSVGCNDCGHKELCPACGMPFVYHEKTRMLACHYCKTTKPMPLGCPKCNSTIVELRGTGTEQVETAVRGILPNKHAHEMIRIDSESSFRFPDEKKPRIIIGTEMAFQHVRWDKTELVTFLDIDKQLALPEFLAAEHVWHLIQEAVYLQNEASIFYIQTFNPRHLVLKSLVEPDRFYRTDLNLRRSLGYPPYQYLVRYFFGHPNQFVAKRQAEQLEWRLKEELTKAKKQIILSSHIEMHPRFYRKKFWYMLLAKLPTKDWEDNLSWLNQYIPGSWKIDPNPISILSP